MRRVLSCFTLLDKNYDTEKCIEYLSFGRSISIILVGSFSTNKSLNFVSISSHWLESYIFLILQSFCLVISFSLLWVWESEILSWVWGSKLLSSLTTLLLYSSIFILLSSSKKTHLYFLIYFFIYFYKFIDSPFLCFNRKFNSSLFFWSFE